MRMEKQFMKGIFTVEKTAIRKNLAYIRDYYRLLKRLRKNKSIVLMDGERKMNAHYDAAMADAPLMIRTVYLQMYHEGMAQKEVASLLGLSERRSSVITLICARDCGRKHKKKLDVARKRR